MSTLPRALRRARRWTAGLLTASTVLVGAIGIHLADAQNAATQTVATQTSSGASDSSSSGASSSSGTSSDASSSDDSSSSSGFSAVAPVSGSNAQAQTSSGGS
jgi:hypothetical protein